MVSSLKRIACFDAAPSTSSDYHPMFSRRVREPAKKVFGQCQLCQRRMHLKKNNMPYAHKSGDGMGRCTGNQLPASYIYGMCPKGHSMCYDAVSKEIRVHHMFGQDNKSKKCPFSNMYVGVDNKGHFNGKVYSEL